MWRVICITWFYRTVRENLRIVLTVSSPGSQFQRRCREFPGLTNHISIMFVPHWSREDLVSCASHLLQGKILIFIRFSFYMFNFFSHWIVSTVCKLREIYVLFPSYTLFPHYIQTLVKKVKASCPSVTHM